MQLKILNDVDQKSFMVILLHLTLDSSVLGMISLDGVGGWSIAACN